MAKDRKRFLLVNDGGAVGSYFMLKKVRLSEISGGLGNFGETLLFFRRF